MLHKLEINVKNYYVKSRMFSAIIAMSIIIFSLAYGALVNNVNRGSKDVLYYSDNYVLVNFVDEKLSVGDFLEKTNSFEYTNIAFIDTSVGYKFVNFTDSFYRQINKDKNDYGNLERGNVAFVSDFCKNQCYLIEGKSKINIYGKVYDVAGFFIDGEGDTYTTCYINAYAPNAKDNKIYHSLAVDTDATTKQLLIEKLFTSIKGIDVVEWSGKVQGLMYTLDTYFYFVFLCGVVLCINCINFADMWMKSYQSELSIRKLVGADTKKNLLFVLKEYIKLFGKVSIFGVVCSKILFATFRIKQLIYVRAIFGTKLEIKVALMSVGTVLLITLTVLIVRNFLMMRKSIASGVNM